MVALRLPTVCSFYRYQHFNSVEAASRLYEPVFSDRHADKPLLEHLARRRGHESRVVRVPRPRRAMPPTLTPGQVRLILDGCARWDERKRDWDGSVRDRLLWALLERGMRLGEALALKHCDWHTGLSDTPFVEVVPREDHPHGLRVKNGGYRRICISDELDGLYGEYLWRLCDAGADTLVGDLDSWWCRPDGRERNTSSPPWACRAASPSKGSSRGTSPDRPPQGSGPRARGW